MESKRKTYKERLAENMAKQENEPVGKINWLSLIVGLFAIGYGIYVIVTL